MNNLSVLKNRILIIDDNHEIHEDFRKILAPATNATAALEAAEAELFGEPVAAVKQIRYEIDSAYQGEEGTMLVQKAFSAGRPYALAFVDIRMPPGWDGVETTRKIWEIDPDIQIVLCTAYSDYSWDEMLEKIGASDGLLILKKPFDTVEALQLAHALTEKWRLRHQACQKMRELEAVITNRTRELLQTNHTLQQKQTELRVLFDLMPALIWFKDTENRILLVNQRVAESIGKSVAEIEGRPAFEIYPQAAEKSYADDLEVINSGVSKLGIIEMIPGKTGPDLWTQTDKVPYRDKDGNVIGIVVMAQDITERKRLEAGLPPVQNRAGLV
jgi:PAS domain S-box-containing protein